MKLGVIGAGNMGRAILSGILASGLITKDDIVASNRTEATVIRQRSSVSM